MSTIITITSEECSELEKLHYEWNSYVTVEKSYLDDHSMDLSGSAIESPIFKAYHNKTIEALKAYEDCKNRLAKKYDLDGKNWTLDFKTLEVTVG